MWQRPSRPACVCVCGGEPVPGTVAPQDKACTECREAAQAQAASAPPGNWPLLCLPPSLPRPGATVFRGLCWWPRASRKKAVCKRVVGKAAGTLPPKFSFRLQISLYGNPQNLGFDSSLQGAEDRRGGQLSPQARRSSGQTVSTRPGRLLRPEAVRSQEGRPGALLLACLLTRNQKPSGARSTVPKKGQLPVPRGEKPSGKLADRPHLSPSGWKKMLFGTCSLGAETQLRAGWVLCLGFPAPPDPLSLSPLPRGCSRGPTALSVGRGSWGGPKPQRQDSCLTVPSFPLSGCSRSGSKTAGPSGGRRRTRRRARGGRLTTRTPPRAVASRWTQRRSRVKNWRRWRKRSASTRRSC